VISLPFHDEDEGLDADVQKVTTCTLDAKFV